MKSLFLKIILCPALLGLTTNTSLFAQASTYKSKYPVRVYRNTLKDRPSSVLEKFPALATVDTQKMGLLRPEDLTVEAYLANGFMGQDIVQWVGIYKDAWLIQVYATTGRIEGLDARVMTGRLRKMIEKARDSNLSLTFDGAGELIIKTVSDEDSRSNVAIADDVYRELAASDLAGISNDQRLRIQKALSDISILKERLR